MIHRYRGPAHSRPARDIEDAASWPATSRPHTVAERMPSSYLFSLALRDIWEVIAPTNKYIADKEPWALAKDASQARGTERRLYQTRTCIRSSPGSSSR